MEPKKNLDLNSIPENIKFILKIPGYDEVLEFTTSQTGHDLVHNITHFLGEKYWDGQILGMSYKNFGIHLKDILGRLSEDEQTAFNRMEKSEMETTSLRFIATVLANYNRGSLN